MSPTVSHDEIRDLAASYVLGALSAAEAAAVREHLASCPEPHPEFAELGGVVPYLAEIVDPVEPPPALRARILAAARAELVARPRTGPETAPAAAGPGAEGLRAAAPTAIPLARQPGPTPGQPMPGQQTPGQQTPGQPTSDERTTAEPIPLRRSRLGAWNTWLLRAAAALVIVALAGWNLLLQADLNTARDYEARVADTLALAAEPGTLLAVLAPTREAPGSPSGIAVLPASGAGRIVMRGLLPTSGSEVYEAWTIAP
ncbi:MAG TPA: zf-HC2 domain-containing protein, partial [Candidatus Limnocylindrales bacterium]